jgi:hypothetical protein
MIRFVLIALMLAIGAAPAAAQSNRQPAAAPQTPPSYTQAELWDRSGDRIGFTLAGISLPQGAGAVSLDETGELGTPGRGLDNTIQFRSGDRQILASVYIYYPPIAHAGLAAFATERGLEILSEGNLRRVSAGTVPVGGVDGAGVRIDYRGYRGDLASSAAFIKVGRWLVKLRVSGPEARRADIDATMTALLASFRFDGTPRPRAGTLLGVPACTDSFDRDARALPDGPGTFGASMLAVFDPLGDPGARNQDGSPSHITGRVGDSWCQSTEARYGQQRTAILRATGPAPVADEGGAASARSVALAIISDSGTILEVIQDGGQFVILFHRIGETFVLGSYDGPPSDEQITNMLTGSDREGVRIRARIGLRPTGDTNIELRSIPGLTDQPPG